jgi:hypothetical protein
MTQNVNGVQLSQIKFIIKWNVHYTNMKDISFLGT